MTRLKLRHYRPACSALLPLLLSLGLTGAALPASAQQLNTDLQYDDIQHNQLMLPELGDSTSSIASRSEEHDVGQAWLRMYRSRVPEARDEQLYDYLQQLLTKLVDHSPLEDKRLELVMVNNPTLNAFAVPGGVVGVHNGIFLYADNEQQLAGVLAHELAHLSQRHWVRSMEQAQQNSIPTLAGLLAGLALMATSGSEAGMAAVMATQAANLESRLRFSRENEAEADRVGMQTMVKADMDPRAVPAMFESMQRATRYMGERSPEFLLSHPVTEKRIADSRNRAEQYPLRQYRDNPEFLLMRSRVRLMLAENPSVAARAFQNEMNGTNTQPDASRYGLALAQIELRQFDVAEKTLQPLLDKEPDRLPYVLAKAEILRGEKKHPQALALLQAEQKRNPHNYPTIALTARVYEDMRQYPQAIKEQESLLDTHRNVPAVWYDLAELRGLAGDTGGVHTARAEYFMLNGDFDKARQQLTYALQFYRNDHMQSARIRQRLSELAELESQALKI